MRVRPKRNLITRRPSRDAHPSTRPAPAPEALAPAQPEPVEHPHQHRSRASGGPIDNAQYTCSCGYVFSAAVSTSVACPHCGAGQAW